MKNSLYFIAGVLLALLLSACSGSSSTTSSTAQLTADEISALSQLQNATSLRAQD